MFRENVGKGKEEFTLDEFKKIVPSRNVWNTTNLMIWKDVIFQEFFVERAFRIFDKDGSGTVSLAEFIETMHQFSGQGEDEKISFLFKVYDLNGGCSSIFPEINFQFTNYAEKSQQIVGMLWMLFIESLIMSLRNMQAIAFCV